MENLTNLIKYCLAYVKLARKRDLSNSQANKAHLSTCNFNLSKFFASEDETPYLINLETFYQYKPDNVPNEKREAYIKEKEIANQLEEICNKYRTDNYTKQIFLEFGSCRIELYDQENESSKKKSFENYKLFALPISIEKKITGEVGKYYVYPADQEVQTNVGILDPNFDENLHFQFLNEIAKLEAEKRLIIPLNNLNVFKEIWNSLKALLRLKDIQFSEESFDLSDATIALTPRANYFLTEDLAKLSNLSEKDFEGTALSGWAKNNNLDIKDPIPSEDQLFFPFPYDRFQLETLSIIKNSASIIQGPPGTGKSTTIANILCHLAAKGKSVLFVSQKSQALKVVKDKLKGLDIKYLFGYIPNPSSQQLGDDDEADGIAPMLNSLEPYSASLHSKFEARNQERFQKKNIRELGTVIDETVNERKRLNATIEYQRLHFKLTKEYDDLKEYDIAIIESNKFKSNATTEKIRELINLTNESKLLITEIQNYETDNHKNKQIFESKFPTIKNQRSSNAFKIFIEQLKKINPWLEQIYCDLLSLEKQLDSHISNQKLEQELKGIDLSQAAFLDALIKLRDDLSKTAYDGHFATFRYINNIFREARLLKVFFELPRELRNYIREFISEDRSRLEIIKFMNELVDHCKNVDNQRQLNIKQQDLIQIINTELEPLKNQLSNDVINWLKDTLFNYNNSLNNTLESFNKLLNHIQYYENNLRLSEIQLQFDNSINEIGITQQTFFDLIEKIDNPTDKKSIEDVINNVYQVQQVKFELEELIPKLNTPLNTSKKTSLQKEREKTITAYIQTSIDRMIYSFLDNNTAFRKTIRKLTSAFGKSKKAFKTFDKLRQDPENFKEVSNLIPIWIMELDDASRIIPLEPNFFDYVVLDEASQCNLAYALPVMYRAEKVVFVGDSEQMRDSTVRFKSNSMFDELAKRFQIPEDQQIKATGTSVQSVLDIAYQRGFPDKVLRYHYRSPKELIGFCNESFYKPKGKELFVANNNHLTYKDTNRNMILHKVDIDLRDEIDDHINVAEAYYILSLFEELRSDEKTKNKSIGILSFFSKQAGYIRMIFEQAGFKEELDNYKVSNIDGVQGDEKDIIIYSFVIRTPDQKNKYIPLTSEGGDINREVNQGRVNVAFSRAREQVHACISMPLEQVPDKIWIKKYLEYIQKHGIVENCELKPFDSYFEETFYTALRNGLEYGCYLIQNQVESCGFKIDFVVTNINTGNRIAIECDGPCHFEDEVDEVMGLYIEGDEHRQRILESAGWTFFRVKYSDWINRDFNQNKVIADIKSLID